MSLRGKNSLVGDLAEAKGFSRKGFGRYYIDIKAVSECEPIILLIFVSVVRASVFKKC